MTPEVLYLDNHLFVVAKPPGMLAQSDATGDESLAEWGKRYIKREYDKPGNVFLGTVHRLDRPVGGVTVLARTSKAASRLSEQFRQRRVDKTYLAFVEERLAGSGTREDWLVKTHSRESGTRVKRSKAGASGAKKAVMHWKALSVVGRKTLVEVSLETGRAHQIRVQLAALGHPIVGDLKYGASGPLVNGRSIALHAVRVAIDHPTQKDRRTFTHAPPTTWGAEVRPAIRDALS